MSIEAYCVEGKSAVGDDYGYVTVLVSWKGHPIEKPTDREKTMVMWAHESVYGVVGSKVGDFVGCYGANSFLQEGVFTHRYIAKKLVDQFSGLKIKEVEWVKNPLEDTLASGKSRVKKAKWLPGSPVDLVHVVSDVYVAVSNPTAASTDFFTAFRRNKSKDGGYEGTWFCCTESAAKRLNAMEFQNLEICKSNIKG
jgi:hypothetical protein